MNEIHIYIYIYIVLQQGRNRGQVTRQALKWKTRAVQDVRLGVSILCHVLYVVVWCQSRQIYIYMYVKAGRGVKK